ncbi:hypothetical protein [Nannocystis bainbridge]|uniref:Uncharacterized protein n=1 Tax=Nannocystis bainbridge TaxID=2995303 RepID=A0ABT5E728_9BACT|nr:hypothetical protein [Nannocystis bainbridge]MDC0721205.1 hypothetical protein [Nannocystis bainbridge]
MASFHTSQANAVALACDTPAELAELTELAVANVTVAALECAPTSDRVQLGAMARAWIEALDRPSLVRLCSTISPRGPRDAVRLVAGVLLTTYHRSHA